MDRFPSRIALECGANRKVVTVATTYTVTLDDDIIIADSAGGGVFTITLPTAAAAYDASTGTSKVVTIVNVHTDDVTVDGAGAETINGAANIVLDVQYERCTLVSNGTAWYAIAL